MKLTVSSKYKPEIQLTAKTLRLLQDFKKKKKNSLVAEDIMKKEGGQRWLRG